MDEGDKSSRAPVARWRARRFPFQDRADAGRKLAQQMSGFARREDCLVLALPRGGVPVGFEVARKLHLPLDVLITRALGVPGREEQIFGAIAADHGAVLDYALIRAAQLTAEQIATAMDRTRTELKARAKALRDGRKPLDVAGKTVILVDDGGATGACLFAGVHILKRMRAAQLVVAVPVWPAAACVLLEREADLLLVLKRPTEFYAMAQLYLNLRSVGDADVLRFLDRNEHGPTRRRGRTPATETP